MKKQFTPKEKAAIALEAIRGVKTISQIASEHQVHPVAVGTWKKQLLENMTKVFAEKQERDDKQKTIDDLYKLVGQRDAELTWLKKSLSPLTHHEKASLVDKDNEHITICRQSELLDISRASLYYKKAPVSQEDIDLMNLIDEIYTKYPFYGSRRIRKELKRKYDKIANRKHIQRLMREMGIETIYPKKNTSKPNIQNQTYPYLLRNLTINRPNQVWGTDITYLKLSQGFAYLVAIMDWFSRYVIAWEVCNSLEIDFVIRNLAKAFKTGKPEIHNSDQGSHFTSPQYTTILTEKEVQISMDGQRPVHG